MATLESSITSVSKSQRARALLVYNGGCSDRTIALRELWEALPSVSQDCRKSSVLEGIAGYNFLPLVSGIGTRQSLVVHAESGQRKYAEFLHLPRKSFTDLSIACDEIRNGTDRLTRRTNQIPPVLIHLSTNCSDDIAGLRTLGALTKSDLMDKGTIAVEIPGIMSDESKTIDEQEDELNHLGRAFSDDVPAQMYRILELCRNFEQTFKEHLNGRRPGGAQIYGILECHLPTALKKLPFDHHLSLQNVRKVVSEADGYLPHLIAPEQAYWRLIESGVTYFTGPAEASVNRVHTVLDEIVRRSIVETQDLECFPALQAAIVEAALEALQSYREDSKKMALQLVEMESSYFTLDFFRKLPQEIEDVGIPGATFGDEYLEMHYRRIRSHVSLYLKMVSETLRHAIPKAIVHCQVREARMSLLDHLYTQICRKKGKELARLLDKHPTFIGKRQECLRKLEFYISSRD